MIALLKKLFAKQQQKILNGICCSAQEFHELVYFSIQSETQFVVDGRSELTRSSLDNMTADQLSALKKQWKQTKSGSDAMFFEYMFALNKKWINVKFNNETPLQYSAKNNALATCKMLVTQGAEVWLENISQGRQPFMLANYHQTLVMGNKDCAAFLLSTKIANSFWCENVLDDSSLTFIKSLQNIGFKNLGADVLQSVLILLKDYNNSLTDIKSDIQNQLQNITLYKALENIGCQDDHASEQPKKRKM